MVSVFNWEVSKPWSRIILLLGIELDTGRARQSCILFFHIVFFHCHFNYSLLLLLFLPSLERQKYHPQSTYYNVIAREEVIVNIPWQQIFNYIFFWWNKHFWWFRSGLEVTSMSLSSHDRKVWKEEHKCSCSRYYLHCIALHLYLEIVHKRGSNST